MKILKNLLITFLLLAAVTSCGKNGEEGKIDPNSGDNAGNNNSAAQESPPEEVFLSGKVISVSHNSDGIADFTLLTDDASIRDLFYFILTDQNPPLQKSFSVSSI